MLSKAVVGGGCFWCIQALLQRLKGVHHVVSGYAGGATINPTYEQVCSTKTGHAEVVQVHYDPTVITYPNLLYVFLHIHDPTTYNQQGNDVGSQYRSIILFSNEEEQKQIKQVIERVTKQGKYPGSPKQIVTEVVKLKQFYPGEKYHQNYYNDHSTQGYCKAVIFPKLAKLKTTYEQYASKAKQ